MGENMKISIVMAYYNRKKLLMNTLHSITLHKYNCELEIIIVDDSSDDIHKLNDLNELFPTLDIKIIEIKEKDKWWVNPCIPFNMGFNEASGDVIIIQNPECLHMSNIINYVENNIMKNKYLVFGCYAINQKEIDDINMLKMDNEFISNILNTINPIKNIKAFDAAHSAWYQHSRYRNELLHFCSAMTKEDLDDLSGFDERFAYGVAKDDREFIIRISRKKMNIVQIDRPFVIHQKHKSTNYTDVNLVKKNKNVLNLIRNEKTHKVNNTVYKK
jgi:glycosyltransferase involved in cell wall biosynthesis